MALSGLFKLQAGVETTWGTSVAATAIWYPINMAGLRDPNEAKQPVERRGSFAPARRSYLSQAGAEGSVEMEATYEDLPFLLGMALKAGVITGAGPYVHTYTPSTVAANTPKFYTLEYGDDVQAFKAAGVLAKALTLSGGVDGPVMAKADLFAKAVSTTTFTGSLSHRTVESILAPLITLFMDDTGGTLGAGAGLKSDGTSIANSSLISWEWRLPAHFYPRHYLAGSLSPTDYGEMMFQPELDLTLAFKASSNTLRTKFTAQTRQLVRLRATSGTKVFTLDGAYTIVGDPLVLDEREGETICQFKLKGEYDSTDALYCSAVVTNSVATLP